MGTVNKVILVGNLGRDAELRHTGGGTAVANLNLATTDVWTDKTSGQRQEKTEWHRVVLWGRQAETLQQYLVRGKQIYVEGRLETRQWDDRDGNRRYTTEVRADRITLLGGRGEGGGGRGDDAGPSHAGGYAGGGPQYDDHQQPGGAEPAGGSSAAHAPAGSDKANLSDDDIPF